jgi:hypothetical protein
MARAISLHIGLNEVDPAVYGSKLELSGCVNDANDLSKIAEKQGYTPTILLNNQATAANIIEQISQNAQALQNGDIFLLTYSGHGSSIPDSTGDEADGQDESWVFYDRQFLDDELYNLWLNFREGVRVFVLSDSCNSGTMLKSVMLTQKLKKTKSAMSTILKNFDKDVFETGATKAAVKKKIKLMPASISYKNYTENLDHYREIQNMFRGVKSQEPAASIILISGCQDDEFSYDYGTNGLFTSKVKETWNRGSFDGTHNRFHTDIAQKVSANQTDQNPNFMVLGKHTSTFAQNKPFIVNAPGWPIATTDGGTGTTSGGTSTDTSSGGTPTQQYPSVNPPASWNINDGQPVINVNKGNNNYYYIEIVNNEQLFDYTYWNDNGNAQNSFFSWNDSSVSNRLTGDRFTIPVHAWNQLKNSEGLYVRIGTTSSSNESEWENHMVSESAMTGSGQHAPFMHLIGSTVDSDTTDPGTQPGSTGPSITDTEQEDNIQISDSVGFRGENKYNDVLLVQSKLNLVPISEGGPSIPLVEDGLYGSKTRNAITRFQREQDLTSSGKIEPGDTTFILLKLKSGTVRIHA